jgi:hypothetical protein
MTLTTLREDRRAGVFVSILQMSKQPQDVHEPSPDPHSQSALKDFWGFFLPPVKWFFPLPSVSPSSQVVVDLFIPGLTCVAFNPGV